jgi:hypothetical protein
LKLGAPRQHRNEQNPKAPVWLLITLCLLLATIAVVGAFWYSHLARVPSTPATSVVSRHLGDERLYPNPTFTPGATDPNVTQDNIQQTICVHGYTAQVRPRSSVIRRLRIEVLAKYQSPGSGQELDHFIPLELGGCPDCVSNLWPEPYEPRPGAREKDRVETYLKSQVCDGSMTLAEAQRAITTDWYRIYMQIK